VFSPTVSNLFELNKDFNSKIDFPVIDRIGVNCLIEMFDEFCLVGVVGIDKSQSVPFLLICGNSQVPYRRRSLETFYILPKDCSSLSRRSSSATVD
jgi:hypothetical protein